jgi:hypothetical protein
LQAQLEPWLQLLPPPRVHADLAAPAALTASDKQRAPARIEIALGKGERFLNAQPSSPQVTISPRRRRPCASSPAARMTAMISSTVGGSAG